MTSPWAPGTWRWQWNGNNGKCFRVALCQALFLVHSLISSRPTSQVGAIIITPILEMGKWRLRGSIQMQSQGAEAVNHHQRCLTADLRMWVFPKVPHKALISAHIPSTPSCSASTSPPSSTPWGFNHPQE